MSFMFHPNPYIDPLAVNPVSAPPEVAKSLRFGAAAAVREIAQAIHLGKTKVGIDGYPGAEFSVLAQLLAQACPEAQIVSTRSLWLDADAFRAKIAHCLPMDLEKDPVLMYGVRFEGSYADFFDALALEKLKRALASEKPVIVIGEAALSEPLMDLYSLRLWADITPRQAAINFKTGHGINLGEQKALPFAQTMRRNYYVDFELAQETRWQLIKENRLHGYLAFDNPAQMIYIPFEHLSTLFECVRQKPFRCRPVYLEGVWGGHYIKRLRNLPKSMRNCAWIFDMIPMEVSLAIWVDGNELEVPFFTFIQHQGEKLLGEAAFKKFGGYFPVRFNYDDTFHSSGNMSIQCHPDENYVVSNHRELGRQDESYYVCVAGENAKTYLGFNEGVSKEAFLQACEHAQETGEMMDYEKFISHVPSKPGLQVMIPAGTVHASGQNQVILEIGSLTIGSYTYKLYDYQRIDPQTGKPRPIHLHMGRQVLRGERDARYAAENLVNHGSLLRQNEAGSETIIGEHDLLYFSLRSLHFKTGMEDDTRGTFHVLALTEGERVRIESLSDPAAAFEISYLDLAVVPATFGRYRLINLGEGPVSVHKTCLKEALLHA